MSIRIMTEPPEAPFLRASWRHLLMLNWAVPPTLLARYCPAGTELDSFHGIFYVSIVAFRFRDTRVLGFAVPWHRNFEEVNLRFYVKRNINGETRRGVVFIREYVPRFWIALIANQLYHEHYQKVPMSHTLHEAPGSVAVEYRWQDFGHQNILECKAHGFPKPAGIGTLEEFITEHYWGYSRHESGDTIEYQVRHPRWNLWESAQLSINLNLSKLENGVFNKVLSAPPSSYFLADGSAIEVMPGNIIGKRP